MDNTPYTLKLQTVFIETGKAVEQSHADTTPTPEELDILYYQYKEAVKGGDMVKQGKTVKKLTSSLIKWQIEKL